MFERFTGRARQVVVLAQEEARALEHDYIGTEHLLLGLLREEEGIAARTLESLGVTVEAARSQVVAIVGRGQQPTTGQIPFTPRAKNSLERALREARALGHWQVGTEHVLLGLVRVRDSLAADVLRALGVDPQQAHDEVIRLLSGTTDTAPLPQRGSPRRRSAGRGWRAARDDDSAFPATLLVVGWVLGVVAFGLGILVGLFL